MVKLIFSELKRKIKFINEQGDIQKIFTKTFFKKDFTFYELICNMYNLADIKRNCRK